MVTILEMHAYPYIEDLRPIPSSTSLSALSQIKSTDHQKVIQKIIDVAFRPDLSLNKLYRAFRLVPTFLQQYKKCARCCDSNYTEPSGLFRFSYNSNTGIVRDAVIHNCTRTRLDKFILASVEV